MLGRIQGFAHLIGPDANNITYSCTILVRKHTYAVAQGLRSLTISCMQLNQNMTEGPICDALNVRFPVCRCTGYRRTWESSERVEVDVVDDRVHDISNNDCEGGRQ